MKRLAMTVLLVALCSCSFTRKTPSPELATALANVSATYLRYVVMADEAKIGNSILWKDFLESNSLTKEAYLAKTIALKGKFLNPQTHPLLQLGITEIDWRGDRATITLQKSSADGTPLLGSPEIVLELFWGSNSWLVVDDNLFAKGELIDAWLRS